MQEPSHHERHGILAIDACAVQVERDILHAPSEDVAMSRPIDPRNIEVVDNVVASILRSKTIAERIEMIGDANDMARILVHAGVKHTHPNWSSRQIQDEVSRRMHRAAN